MNLEMDSSAKPDSNDNFSSGWGADEDDNWKDLDDDNDLMEPLEPISASVNSAKNEPFSSPKGQQQADWADDWASSFEPTPKPKLNLSTKPAAAAGTKTTSSYNWTQNNAPAAANEEDLFASLVKDVKPASIASNAKVKKIVLLVLMAKCKGVTSK